MISHDVYNKNSTHGSKKLYETTNGGRGVLISLENKEETPHTITEKSETPLSMPIDNTTTIQEEKSNNTNEKKKGNDMYEKKNITLAKRFTKVAEYMLKESSSGGVLTTSPAVDHRQQVAVDYDIQAAKKKNITTIEIECMKCGSDTRAEGGARAFVRGPEPLSIVLCSNRLSSQREVDEVLVHELVHIYGKLCVSSSFFFSCFCLLITLSLLMLGGILYRRSFSKDGFERLQTACILRSESG